MPISATTAWEVRTTGSDTNGGGFDSSYGGTDYTLQASPQVSVTDAVSNSTTTLTSATAGFTAAMVGNVVYLTGGTASLPTMRRQVVAYTNSTTVTLDEALPSTGTGITLKLGGALLTIDECFNGQSFTGTGSCTTTTLTIATVTFGTVTLGMRITTGAAADTFIVGFLTGTGGTGTYAVSISQTIAAATALVGTSSFVGGNTIFVKSGTYSKTSTVNVFAVGGYSLHSRIIGYDTTRTVTNNDTSKPLFTSATNSVTIWTLYGCSFCTIRNISFSSTAATRGDGWRGTAAKSYNVSLQRCVFDGLGNGINQQTSGATSIDAMMYQCEIKNCTVAGVRMGQNNQQTYFEGCYIHDNAIGITAVGTTTFPLIKASFSVFANNTTRAFNGSGFTTGGFYIRSFHCVYYNNGTAHIECAQSSTGASWSNPNWFYNNIIWGGTDGVKCGSAAISNLGMVINKNNAYGGQSGSARVNFDAGEGDITLSADPFINAAGGDFRLNRAVGGGALLRMAGFSDVLFGAGDATRSFDDVGAIEQSDRYHAEAFIQ